MPRARAQYCSDSVALRDAFQRRLARLFAKQRHTPSVRSTDPRNALRVERGIAGQSLHERLAVTFAEPIEQLATYSSRSGQPEFGANGDDPQRREPA